MMDLEQTREFFKEDRFATEATGIEIVEVTEEEVTCRLTLERHHRNAVGGVMGGVLFTLADFVFAIATNSKEKTTVTTVAQISFLGAAKGNILTAKSKLLRDGRRNCFYEVSITDELENLVSVVSLSGVHLK